MTKKKNKFDLTHFVHDGSLKEGQTLLFVSDPAKKCKISKQPNGEFKVMMGNETLTIHAFAQRCLGEDPPDHATRWIRTEAGKTLYELWHEQDLAEAA
ncbi:MAG: hypothetical protein ACO3A2_01130 [Bdellovibrionia bacterium]